MIFEVGKTYQHNSGDRMTIIGRLKTYIHGECLIGERDTGELVPVGESEANAVNWHEQEYQHKAESEDKEMVEVGKKYKVYTLMKRRLLDEVEVTEIDGSVFYCYSTLFDYDTAYDLSYVVVEKIANLDTGK